MRRGPAGALAAVSSSVIAGGLVLVTQLGGGAATPTPSPSSPSTLPSHASAVHAWVACKAQKGEDACDKPLPPGLAKRDGTAPGPASEHGHGYGWGRAHAPGQLKAKHHDKSEDEDESDEPDEPDAPDAD